ncbi:MAG: oxygen-independent coproporphyrinogen III oxidase [Bacteroidales bacterium]
MEVDKKIIEKYDRPGPRYTSYPPANLFREDLGEKDYLEVVRRSNKEGLKGISLYVHVPFCPRLCYFCGCNTQLGNDEAFIRRYFDAVLKETDRIAAHIDRDRPVTQIHWGGGTPNSVEWALIGKVMDRFNHHFRISGDAEIAMECSPAYLDLADIDVMTGMGFNRISIGIQDFNESVLRIIHRLPSKLPVEELVRHIRATSRAGINFDFVYGLPGQTQEGYLDTLKRAASMKPDRMVTFSYAHVPWIKNNQKILEKTGIPGPGQKLDMLLGGYSYLTDEGYDPVGMDHFALPGDEMAEAFRNNLLHRNFQGYCTMKHTGQVYAFGASSISQLHQAYFQNTRTADSYIQRIENSGLATDRGYILNEEEKVVRSVINQVMCNGALDLNAEAIKLGLELSALKEILDYSEEKFKELENDGLIILGRDRIKATPEGMLLIRVLARKLDPCYESYRKSFSRTI